MTDFETKDSGQHQEYDSGMRRDTQEGKPRFALMWTKLQPYAEQMVTRYAALLARGAAKYADRNWEQGDSEVELERAKDSLLRHAAQLVAGETDEDHAAAVWFNTQAIEYFRWRVAEKAKSNTMTFDFKADSAGSHLIELITGGAITLVRGEAVLATLPDCPPPASGFGVPQTVFTPKEEAEIEVASGDHEVRTSEEAPYAVADDSPVVCQYCGDGITDYGDMTDWYSTGHFGGTGAGAFQERVWCVDAPDHKHGPAEQDWSDVLVDARELRPLPDFLNPMLAGPPAPPLAFVDEGAAARKAHQDAINAWHNRPVTDSLAGLPIVTDPAVPPNTILFKGKHARTEPDKTALEHLQAELEPTRPRESISQKVASLVDKAYAGSVGRIEERPVAGGFAMRWINDHDRALGDVRHGPVMDRLFGAPLANLVDLTTLEPPLDRGC